MTLGILSAVQLDLKLPNFHFISFLFFFKFISAIRDAKSELPLNMQYFSFGEKHQPDVMESIHLNPILARSSRMDPPSGYTTKFNGRHTKRQC